MRDGLFWHSDVRGGTDRAEEGAKLNVIRTIYNLGENSRGSATPPRKQLAQELSRKFVNVYASAS